MRLPSLSSKRVIQALRAAGFTEAPDRGKGSHRAFSRTDAAGRVRLVIVPQGSDIEIKFTGLRQGEKMDEELMEDPAGCSPSEHSHIMVLRGENEPLADLDKRVLDLEIALRGIDSSAVVRRLSDLVPTFRPAAAHTPVPGTPGSAA